MANQQNHLSVSLVILAFNEERNIAACLESIAAQTYKPLEVIVVDNNSTDSTAKIVKRYKFATIIQESIQGISYARNAGFDAARGDVIARTDADAVLPTDWLEKVARHFKDAKVVGVSGGAELYDHPFKRLSGLIFNFFIKYGNLFISGDYILFGSNMALRSDTWQKIRNDVNNDSRVWDDHDMSMLARKWGSILFDESIRVNISARSALKDPISVFKYYLRMPRTYKRYSLWNRFAAWVLFVFFALTLWVPEIVAIILVQIKNDRKKVL